MISMLIVDDDEDILEMMLDSIEEQYGFNTVGVNSGVEASKLLGTTYFDIVIIDLFMPELNGFDLLKDFSSQSSIYVISGDRDQKKECLELGAKGFISKPFTQEEFVDKLIKT